MWVEEIRGAVAEARHRVHAVVVDPGGRPLARTGDPGLVTFWRSGAKPFQALPMLRDGAAEHFGVTSEELAISCASHSSEPRHVDLVRGLLAKAGLSERDLLCGPHAPLSESVARDYAKRGVRLTAVHSNCSGNHAAMLVLARHHGWPVDFYVRPEHPVQQRCLAEVSEWTGVAPAQIGTATDGCGVVCFALPLQAMAWAYARLGMAASDPGSARDERAGRSAATVVAAMLRYPELLAGEGRACTEMMRAHPAGVVTKAGAAGVYCAWVVREGLGVALKVEDGHATAAALAMSGLLAELGLRPQPDNWRSQSLVNTRGDVVGTMRVHGGLGTD